MATAGQEQTLSQRLAATEMRINQFLVVDEDITRSLEDSLHRRFWILPDQKARITTALTVLLEFPDQRKAPEAARRIITQRSGQPYSNDHVGIKYSIDDTQYGEGLCTIAVREILDSAAKIMNTKPEMLILTIRAPDAEEAFAAFDYDVDVKILFDAGDMICQGESGKRGALSLGNTLNDLFVTRFRDSSESDLHSLIYTHEELYGPIRSHFDWDTSETDGDWASTMGDPSIDYPDSNY